MKKKTLCRALAIACLLSVLAACAREAAPPEETPAASAQTELQEDWERAKEECRRLTLNAMAQNKGRMRMCDVLALDRSTFFADYDGSPTQAVEYPELDAGEPLSDPRLTNAAYFWRDEDELRKTATPKKGAQELICVMLEHMQSLPRECRSFEITDFSVEAGIQIPRGWESIVDEAFAHSIAGPDYTVEETITVMKDYLSQEAAKDVPFAYPDCGYALGEDMWALVPSFEAEYADGEPRRPHNGSGEMTFILMRDGDVWRMQRAAAMEQLFAETPLIQRIGDYTLSRLEMGVIEGAYDLGAYVEDADKEYLRRIRLDPEGMYAHMDELGFPRLAHLCAGLSTEANAEGFEPEGDSCSAQLLAQYTARRQRETGEGERALPPATGIICPAALSEKTRAGTARIQYADERLLIFQAGSGLFAYDLEKREFVFSADVLTAMGWASVESSWVTHALVDADGGRIRLAYSEEQWDHWLVRYEIDTSDWSWKFVEYELPNGEMGDVFEYDFSGAEHGRLDWEAQAGDNGTDLLKNLVYIRGGETLRLFDGVDFSAEQKSVPVPSKDLEQSIHNALLCRYTLPGDFLCEAHETLDVRSDGEGNTLCCVAAAVEAFSRANGEALSTSFARGPAALTFRTDGEGRYVLTDFRDESAEPHVFPADMRGMEYDVQRDQALSDSCISQAMEHFGLPA